ncbi:MAG: glycerol-3-phosphate dehydrogenase/oxidase [Gemmatimonadales bacterium]
MRRDLSRLLERTFDLLVVGAGIQGACIAWDACLRGLTVALVDRGDFGAATSANSLGIVHGGLRYLARGDLPRMLDSIRERSALLRIAPGLVEPLPVLVPTYQGGKGRVAFRTALLLNDVISRTRNRELRPVSAIPDARLISRSECLRLFPWFPADGLTGGALWYDGRLRHPERLTLSFVRSAAERGVVPVNYLRVERILVRNRQVTGVQVTDLAQGSQFEVMARSVVVAAGPWTESLISGTLGKAPGGMTAGHALAVNIRVDRVLSSVAIGVRSRTGRDWDPVGGGKRFLFAAPQPGTTLLGTWYAPAGESHASPDQGSSSLLQEFNQACPGLELSAADVASCQWGWLRLKGTEKGRSMALAERPRIIDHGTTNSVGHLFSVEPVKYTTARSVAERVVDWVFRDLGRKAPACTTAEVPLAVAGTDAEVTASDIRRAVHEEMAVKLGDIVFRRSNLGNSGRPDRAAVTRAARLAGAELGWDTMRQGAEVDEVMNRRQHPVAVEEPVG